MTESASVIAHFHPTGRSERAALALGAQVRREQAETILCIMGSPATPHTDATERAHGAPHEAGEDRRRFPRVRAPIFFQIPRLRDEHRPVLDVSLGGLRVYSDDRFQVGDRFQLELLLPPDGTEISALAQVSWVEPLAAGAPAKFDVGFELLIVDDDGLRLLGRALEAGTPA